jgi:hypothetical protein
MLASRRRPRELEAGTGFGGKKKGVPLEHPVEKIVRQEKHQ